jgi:hypothetical protein
MRPLYLILALTLLFGWPVAEAGRQSVAVDMANVDLHVTADIALHVNRMRGRFDGVGTGAPYLDDKRSYQVAIEDGEISIDVASLNRVIAAGMGGDKSNVEKLRVWFNEDGTLGQRGSSTGRSMCPSARRRRCRPRPTVVFA